MTINDEIIDDFAYKCTDEQYIRIGENVTKIGEKAFANSPNLTSVKIEDSENPIRICLNAFSGCKNLVMISIKRDVEFYKQIKHGRKL